MTEEWGSPQAEAEVAALVRQALPREPGADARERARAAVEAEWRAAVATRRKTAWLAAIRRPPARRLAVAASLLVAGVAATFGWLATQRPADRPEVASLERGALAVDGAALAPGGSVAAGDSIVATGSAGALLRLGPGLNLRLAAGTSAVVVDAARVELGGGRLFVDSLPGADQPLVVATALGEVRHLGTQYEVVHGATVVEVAVREGRVQVSAREGALAAGAGELLRLRPGEPVERGTVADASRRFGWIAALPTPVTIDGRPLAEFLAWYARETGRQVEFESAELSRRAPSIVLSGSVEGLAPEAALEVVAASTNLGVRRSPGRIELGMHEVR